MKWRLISARVICFAFEFRMTRVASVCSAQLQTPSVQLCSAITYSPPFVVQSPVKISEGSNYLHRV